MPAAPSKPRPPLPPGPFLVVGLARSGSAIARVLAGRGEQVVGVDAGNPPAAEGLQAAGVEVHLNADGSELLPRVNTLVKSPGVPQDAPVVATARERGIDVIGELEVSWRLLPNRFVAVTGTNGKTTVTELLGHIWRAAGQPVAVAGNVGTPLASLVGEVEPEATIVAESSSFQLEDSVEFAPECAVFLNLAPDHLDRHPTLDDYLEAKLRIFANQDSEDVAVYNAGDPTTRGRQIGGEGRRVAFCRDGDGCEVTLSDDAGTISAGGEPLIEVGALRLLGEHNVDNAMAAAAAALAMGIDREAVASALGSFEGVPHRLERVGEAGGVLYVNDSKATNVAAALTGLRAFEGGVWLILGGRAKGESFASLVEPVIERCHGCLLIGEASETLHSALAPASKAGIELKVCAGLGEAVAAAAGAARAGDVVLLSPACASFDAYRDFEQRGEHFKELVGRLG